jgi:hypothetical protein
MLNPKAKAKQNPGFIPLSRCQYKLADHKQLEEPENAAPWLDAFDHVSQAEPACIDPAIRAPKDQLDEEEEQAGKAPVIAQLILVLKAIAAAKEGSARKPRRRWCKFNEYLTIADLNDGRIAIKYLYPKSGYRNGAIHYHDILKHTLQGVIDSAVGCWIYPKEREAEIKEMLTRLTPLKEAEIEREREEYERMCREAAAVWSARHASFEDEDEDETGKEALSQARARLAWMLRAVAEKKREEQRAKGQAKIAELKRLIEDAQITSRIHTVPPTLPEPQPRSTQDILYDLYRWLYKDASEQVLREASRRLETLLTQCREKRAAENEQILTDRRSGLDQRAFFLDSNYYMGSERRGTIPDRRRAMLTQP